MKFKHFCFSVIFTDLKTLTSHLAPLIYDRSNLLDAIFKTRHQCYSNDWFDPLPGAQLPEFFIGEIDTSDNDSKTVFLSNLADGWTTGARKFSRLSKAKSLQIVLSADDEQSAMYKYEVIESGETVRVVQLYKEGKWIFLEEGTALPYENKECYLHKRKSDRLNNELIIKYLNAEGINFDTLISQPLTGLSYKRLSW